MVARDHPQNAVEPEKQLIDDRYAICLSSFIFSLSFIAYLWFSNEIENAFSHDK